MAMLNNQMVISGVVKIPAQLFYLNPDMRAFYGDIAGYMTNNLVLGCPEMVQFCRDGPMDPPDLRQCSFMGKMIF